MFSSMFLLLRYTFSTRSFLIRYCEEEVELGDIGQFRLELGRAECLGKLEGLIYVEPGCDVADVGCRLIRGFQSLKSDSGWREDNHCF